MKPFKYKNTTKKLIIILVIIAMLGGLFPVPNSAVTDPGDGGNVLAPLENFVVYLCDKVMQWLQETFTTLDEIEQEDGSYNFQYSPAIIFSGTVPAFDINFIEPNQDERNDIGDFFEKNDIEYRKDVRKNGNTVTWDDFDNKLNDAKKIDGVQIFYGPEDTMKNQARSIT